MPCGYTEMWDNVRIELNLQLCKGEIDIERLSIIANNFPCAGIRSAPTFNIRSCLYISLLSQQIVKKLTIVQYSSCSKSTDGKCFSPGKFTMGLSQNARGYGVKKRCE